MQVKTMLLKFYRNYLNINTNAIIFYIYDAIIFYP